MSNLALGNESKAPYNAIMPHPYPDISESEIRSLIKKKLHSHRWEKVKHYEKIGRAFRLSPEQPSQGLQAYRSHPLSGAEYEKPDKSNRTSIGGKALLFFEWVVISAVIFTLLAGFSQFRALNQEVARTFILPVLTPTPLVQAVIIPSGHTPPTLSGETRPNDAEIPAHLKPLAQAYAFIPTPTPGIEQGIRIQIPAIQVDAPIVQGDGWDQLKKGVGQHIGTANPGQNGNMVLTGHNDVFGEVFRHLDRLKPGDEIVIYTSRRSYVYLIAEWFLVEPTQIEVMAPTTTPTVTLISCYPYMINTQRIIVKAHLTS